MLRVDGLPELTWLADRAGEAHADGSAIGMMAPASSDWFNDPQSATRHASAPAAVFRPVGDFQLAARVTVDFRAAFDAAVLLVHDSDDDYAKLCFEFSPDGEPMVVSVVTRGVSDDANGPVIDASTVWLRVSRIGTTYAFHHSVDGHTWRFTRLFALRHPSADASVGFVAQSPTGEACDVRFDDISFRPTTLADLRNGT